MTHELTMQEICWLLLKKEYDNDDVNITKINNEILIQLRQNVFYFAFIICKMFRKTNDEVSSLLEFSFQRFKSSSEFKNVMLSEHNQ